MHFAPVYAGMAEALTRSSKTEKEEVVSMETQYSNDPLLLQLYRCCTETGAWQTVLDQLCDEIGAWSAVVQAIDFTRNNHGQTYWCVHDSQTDFGAYQSVISDVRNPRLDRRRSMLAFGRFVGDDQMYTTREEMLQNKWFYQSLADLGYGRFLGALVPLSRDRFVAIALHRSITDHREFCDADRQRLASLLPHLGQATELALCFSENKELKQVLGACLDRWQCGVVVCDASGRVRWMNRSAQAQIARNSALHVREGTLSVTGEKDAILRRALLSRQPRNSHTFLTLDHSCHRLHLAIQPLVHTYDGRDADGTVVMISDGNLCCEIPPTALAGMFGLTQAESLLASAIVQGSTLEEYADRRGVSIGTVRCQLRQVLSKTGTSRQSELTRTVLCSVAAHAAGFEPASMH